MYWLCIFYFIYALNLEGPVILSNQNYDNLTITGDAILDNVTVDNLIVYGLLKADNITSNTIRVNGSIIGNKISANRLDVSGRLQLENSSVDDIFALSDVRFRWLRTKNLYLFKTQQEALYAVRADSIIVKTATAASIIIDDACYIENIIFSEASGEVFIKRDRSFVGDVSSGVIRR